MLAEGGQLLARPGAGRQFQHIVAQAELADILEQGRDEHVARLLPFQAQRLRQLARQLGHPPRMADKLAAAHLDQVGKHLDGRHKRGLQALIGRLHLVVRLFQLLRARRHLRFQAGVERLQLHVLAGRQRFQAQFFLFQRAPFQRVAHHQHDIVLVPGLGHVAVDFALVDGVEDGLDIGIARQQQAYGAGPALAHLGQELRAIHVRHAHVGDDQVHRLALEQGQARRAAVGRQHAVAVRAEQPPQRREDIRFVVDAQDGRRRGRGAGAGAGTGAGTHAVLFGHGATACAWRTGKVMRKVVPRPMTLRTSMRPWCFCTVV